MTGGAVEELPADVTRKVLGTLSPDELKAARDLLASARLLHMRNAFARRHVRHAATRNSASCAAGGAGRISRQIARRLQFIG